MNRPLNIAPDIDDEDAEGRHDAIGPKYLRDFEEERNKLETALLNSNEDHDVQDAVKQSAPVAEDSPSTESTNDEPKESAPVDKLKEELGEFKRG